MPSHAAGTPRAEQRSQSRDRTRNVAAIVDALNAVVRELRLASRETEQLVGLHAAQLTALHQLALSPVASLTELADRTHTDISSVSVVVSRLVEQGLVARRPADHDKRRHALGLTTRGRAVVRRSPLTGNSRLLRAAQRLSDREMHTLASALNKLAEGLRDGGAEP